MVPPWVPDSVPPNQPQDGDDAAATGGSGQDGQPPAGPYPPPPQQPPKRTRLRSRRRHASAARGEISGTLRAAATGAICNGLCAITCGRDTEGGRPP